MPIKSTDAPKPATDDAIFVDYGQPFTVEGPAVVTVEQHERGRVKVTATKAKLLNPLAKVKHDDSP